MSNQPSINAKAGRAFVLKTSDGTTPTQYSLVTGMRTTGLKINGGSVDITNKGSAGWRELLPGGGVKSIDIDFGGIWNADDPVLKQLQAAILNGTLLEAEVVSGGGDKFQGLWDVSSFTRNGPHDNAETYEGALQSSGPVVYAAS